MTPADSPPPERKPTTPQDLRANPLVTAITTVIAIMAGLTVLQIFVTTTLPWLASFLGPAAAAFARIPPPFLLALSFASSVATIRLTIETQRLMRAEALHDVELLRQAALATRAAETPVDTDNPPS